MHFIEKSINDREYEAIGCYISHICRSSHNFLTSKSDDYGIDFLSIISGFGSYHLFPNCCKQIKIIGQSKKWNTRVTINTIDLLTECINRIKYRNTTLINKLPSWIYTENGSIIGLVISHKGFQSGAIDRAKDFGITLADTRDVAEIISLNFPLSYSIKEITEDIKSYVSNKISESN
jgi:hypothetical protein